VHTSQCDNARQITVLLQLGCDLSSYGAMDSNCDLYMMFLSYSAARSAKNMQVMLGDNQCSLAVHRSDKNYMHI